VLGVILLVGGPGLVGFAQTELDSSLAALIASTSPIWMALLTAAQTHRRPNPQVFGALIMGIIGIGVMLGGPGDSVPVVPALLVLVSALFWSSGTVLSRTMPLPRSPFMATGLQLLFGGLGLNVVAGVRGEYAEFAFADISGRSWIGFAWLVIGGSLIAYSAYMYANASLPIEIVSTYAYVNPVIAVVLGAMFDNDATGPNVLIGGAIILLAVIFIVSGHIIHRQRPHPGA
jgi:drug/metabolite transporter (DMT)-like permease